MTAHWHLRCDRKGCDAIVRSEGATDSEARRSATFAAEAAGWAIERWRPVERDLCPLHAPLVREPPPRRMLRLETPLETPARALTASELRLLEANEGPVELVVRAKTAKDGGR